MTKDQKERWTWRDICREVSPKHPEKVRWVDIFREMHGHKITWAEIPKIFYSPDYFWGAIFTILGKRNRDNPHALRIALHNLTTCEHFPKKKLFYITRRELLRKNFDQRRKSTEDFKEAWEKILEPNLLLAIRDHADDLGKIDPPEVLPFLRGEIRKQIEKDLLDGDTLDRREDKKFLSIRPFEKEREEEELPPPNEVDIDREMVRVDESKNWAHRGPSREKMLLRLAELSNLSQKEFLAIVASYEEGGDEALAIAEGKTEGAIRKRRERGLAKLRGKGKIPEEVLDAFKMSR